MVLRIIIALALITGGYGLYKIYGLWTQDNMLHTPLAEFTVYPREDGNKASVTIVSFMNYDCGGCKDTHLALLELVSKRPDIALVVRPVPFGNEGAETAAERALAAGLQGKFWEMDRALSDYKGPLDEKFYRESAALYEIDYDAMVLQAEGEQVQAMAGENAAIALGLDIKSTPALLVGRTLYQPEKALTVGELVRMVETEQNRQKNFF
jgi:protein-disulfide isomerase